MDAVFANVDLTKSSLTRQSAEKSIVFTEFNQEKIVNVFRKSLCDDRILAQYAQDARLSGT